MASLKGQLTLKILSLPSMRLELQAGDHMHPATGSKLTSFSLSGKCFNHWPQIKDSVFLKIYFYCFWLYVGMSMSAYRYVHVSAGALGGQSLSFFWNRHRIPLELEVQTAVNCLMWELIQFLWKNRTLLTTKPSLQPQLRSPGACNISKIS